MLAQLTRLIVENVEERVREFKRRFLPIYTTKAQSQMLRRCGNECQTQWD